MLRPYWSGDLIGAETFARRPWCGDLVIRGWPMQRYSCWCRDLCVWRGDFCAKTFVRRPCAETFVRRPLHGWPLRLVHIHVYICLARPTCTSVRVCLPCKADPLGEGCSGIAYIALGNEINKLAPCIRGRGNLILGLVCKSAWARQRGCELHLLAGFSFYRSLSCISGMIRMMRPLCDGLEL